MGDCQCSYTGIWTMFQNGFDGIQRNIRLYSKVECAWSRKSIALNCIIQFVPSCHAEEAK